MTKNIFITGGCGFVGRHLTKRLLKENSKIWIVDDLSTGKHPREWLTSIELQRIKFFQCNVISFFLEQFKNLNLPYFSNIFHLASIVGGRMNIEKNPILVGTDLAIDSLFFQWVTKHSDKIGHVLYASSSAAYPIHFQTQKPVALKEEYISFDSKLGMPDMTYGWSKLTGEYLSRLSSEKYGIRIACVRPFSGYGGDQDKTYPIPAIASRALKRENPLTIWGSGNQGRDFVHIDDCIEGIILATKKIKDGRGINIGTGQLTTFKQIASMLALLVGYSPSIKTLESNPVGVYARYSDTTNMKRLLNWEPKISLKQGLSMVLKNLQNYEI